jgi:hypothetical protein
MVCKLRQLPPDRQLRLNILAKTPTSLNGTPVMRPFCRRHRSNGANLHILRQHNPLYSYTTITANDIAKKCSYTNIVTF